MNRMKHVRTKTTIIISVLLGLGISMQAQAFTGQKKYSSQARISKEQALSIVQKELPGGKIVKSELEKEKGGSGLRYTFDVKSNGAIHEVGVDAKTGKVLENSMD